MGTADRYGRPVQGNRDTEVSDADGADWPPEDSGHDWEREGYVTRDSGAKAEYADGMHRDDATGKPSFTLMFPKGVPFEDQLITRVADLYARGAVRYGDRNWEKSNTGESLAHHEEALMRHVVKFLLGVDDGEDHAAAVVFNVNAVDLTRRNIRHGQSAKPVRAPSPWKPWDQGKLEYRESPNFRGTDEL